MKTSFERIIEILDTYEHKKAQLRDEIDHLDQSSLQSSHQARARYKSQLLDLQRQLFQQLADRELNSDL